MSNASGGSWGVLFGGVYLGDGYTPQQAMCSYGMPGAITCSDVADTITQPGYLTAPPDGLGLPGLTTSDYVRVGFDGVVHGEDYYEPRFLTFTAYVEPGDPDCGDCLTARENVDAIITAWRRRYKDEELVLFPLCGASCDNSHLGRALGFIGRPRVATVTYDEAGGASILLRFDCEDHRAYMLDGEATPGSGADTVRLNAVTTTSACPDITTNPIKCAEGFTPFTVLNPGSIESEPVLTFVGTGYRPTLVNITNGTVLQVNMALSSEYQLIYRPADFTLYLKDNNNGGALSPLRGSVVSGNFEFSPGANDVVFMFQHNNVTGSGTGYCLADYRPARLTV